jgi:phage-related protein
MHPMPEVQQRLPVLFYRTDTGNEPRGWPIGMPPCRSLGGGLWEVRSSLTSARTARIIFCIHEGQLLLLHGFMKKSQKTPPNAIALAVKRMKGS